MGLEIFGIPITIIIIIIMPCWSYGFPRLSLAIPPYRPSLPAGRLDYILSPDRIVEYNFLLVVQHLHVLGKRSIGGRHLWDNSYFFGSASHVSSVLIGWF